MAMTAFDIEKHRELVSQIYDVAGAYNVFLGDLVLALVKEGTLSEVQVATMLEKQEGMNTRLPMNSPANYAFDAFAQRIRLALSLSPDGKTHKP